MKNKKEKIQDKIFTVVVLAIIFDTKKRKILIGRKENDPHIKELSWVFPGGRLNPEETEEETIKKEVKKETGLEIENLGTVFSRIPIEKKDLFLIYNLCEVIGGEEKAGGDLKELKWVSPNELERFFTTSFNYKLKEYINNLK